MEFLIKKYLKYLHIERNASLHTVISYQNDLTAFLNFCASHFAVQTHQVHVENTHRLLIRLWLGELSDKGYKKNSIARKVAAVKSFFKYCFKRGYITKNPAHLLVVSHKRENSSQNDYPRRFDPDVR